MMSSQRICGAKDHLGEPPQPANERKPIECKKVQRRHETVTYREEQLCMMGARSVPMATKKKRHVGNCTIQLVQMEVTEFRMGKTLLAYSSTPTQFGQQHQP